jgi:hypothetical protein
VDRVFSKWDNQSYPYRFQGRLELGTIVGGVPSDPKVAEGWLRSKLQDNDDRIREMVAQVMIERSVGIEEATEEVNNLKNLNGFKNTPQGVLFIEGRQLKAAVKEAVSIAVAAKKLEMTGWGATKKWLTNFLPEHVFVLEETLELHQWAEQPDPKAGKEGTLVKVTKPSGISQQFVHTHRGSSIQYQEYVTNAVVVFNIISDHPFTTKDWAMIWTTGERNGLGASRSQGYGTYGVTQWDQLDLSGKKTK